MHDVYYDKTWTKTVLTCMLYKNDCWAAIPDPIWTTNIPYKRKIDMLSSTDNNFMICLVYFERFSIEYRFPFFFILALYRVILSWVSSKKNWATQKLNNWQSDNGRYANWWKSLPYSYHCQFRARRALSLFKDVPLKTRRALSPQTLSSNSSLLVLNRTTVNIDSALLALNRRRIYFLLCLLQQHLPVKWILNDDR